MFDYRSSKGMPIGAIQKTRLKEPYGFLQHGVPNEEIFCQRKGDLTACMKIIWKFYPFNSFHNVNFAENSRFFNTFNRVFNIRSLKANLHTVYST